MSDFTKTKLFLERMFEIFKIAFLACRKKKLAGSVRLRIFFEKTGGGFIKLGQILALRQDLLPFEYTRELLKLLNNVPETPFNEMEIVFAEEKGMPIKAFFSEFDPNPIASASIGQVYKAKLKDGSLVAIKIQRPGAREIFERDFVLISFAAGIIDFFRIFSSVNAHEVAADFISWTRSELDFRLEAKNAAILYEHALKHPRTIIPKQYLRFSTERVLIQEFIEDGVAVEDIILGKADRDALVEKMIDPEEMALYLISESMRQYFIDGFFHADPHPANLLFLPGNKLVYFDFGIVGEAVEHRMLFLNVLYSVAKKDIDSLSKYFMEFGEEVMNKDLENYLKMDIRKRKPAEKILEKIKEIILKNLATDMKEAMIPWFEAITNQNASLKEKSAAAPFFKIIKKAEQYGTHLPREIILFFRALAILDMVALQVSPDFDMIKALNRFFEKRAPEEIEMLIKEGEHEEDAGKKITPLTDVDWEFFREISALEKERMWAARERIIDLIMYYAEQYDEIGSMVKKFK